MSRHPKMGSHLDESPVLLIEQLEAARSLIVERMLPCLPGVLQMDTTLSVLEIERYVRDWLDGDRDVALVKLYDIRDILLGQLVALHRMRGTVHVVSFAASFVKMITNNASHVDGIAMRLVDGPIPLTGMDDLLSRPGREFQDLRTWLHGLFERIAWCGERVSGMDAEELVCWLRGLVANEDWRLLRVLRRLFEQTEDRVALDYVNAHFPASCELTTR